MAVVNTGMSKAEMKKMLAHAKESPVSCAVGQGENAAVGLLVMHRTKAERAMEKILKDDFPEAKNSRFGTAFIDVDENPKLVKFKLNRAVSGIARRLIKTLKGTGYTKVVIVTEDGSVVENYEEEDEEAEAGEAEAGAAASPQAAAAPPPPPPPAPPPPAGAAAGQAPPDAAALAKELAALAPAIPKAAGDDMARKATLLKLATDTNVNIKTGNLVYAANFLQQLKTAMAGSAPAAAQAAPAPASVQQLAASRQEWTGVQEKVKAEVEKLRSELAKAYQGQPIAGEIVAKFQAKVAPVTAQFDDRLLDVLDDLMNTKEPAGRDALVGQARGLIKTYLSFAMSDPFIGELDANPFVKLAIKPTVTSTLANLAKSLH